MGCIKKIVPEVALTSREVHVVESSIRYYFDPPGKYQYPCSWIMDL
jgi:hypothetical protein